LLTKEAVELTPIQIPPGIPHPWDSSSVAICRSLAALVVVDLEQPRMAEILMHVHIPIESSSMKCCQAWKKTTKPYRIGAATSAQTSPFDINRADLPVPEDEFNPTLPSAS